ncbi:MAG TPA: hypothetical protein VIS07_13740 [Candidatus Binatia bacterium]
MSTRDRAIRWAMGLVVVLSTAAYADDPPSPQQQPSRTSIARIRTDNLLPRLGPKEERPPEDTPSGSTALVLTGGTGSTVNSSTGQVFVGPGVAGFSENPFEVSVPLGPGKLQKLRARSSAKLTEPNVIFVQVVVDGDTQEQYPIYCTISFGMDSCDDLETVREIGDDHIVSVAILMDGDPATNGQAVTVTYSLEYVPDP